MRADSQKAILITLFREDRSIAVWKLLPLLILAGVPVVYAVAALFSMRLTGQAGNVTALALGGIPVALRRRMIFVESIVRCPPEQLSYNG